MKSWPFLIGSGSYTWIFELFLQTAGTMVIYVFIAIIVGIFIICQLLRIRQLTKIIRDLDKKYNNGVSELGKKMT